MKITRDELRRKFQELVEGNTKTADTIMQEATNFFSKNANMTTDTGIPIDACLQSFIEAFHASYNGHKVSELTEIGKKYLFELIEKAIKFIGDQAFSSLILSLTKLKIVFKHDDNLFINSDYCIKDEKIQTVIRILSLNNQLVSHIQKCNDQNKSLSERGRYYIRAFLFFDDNKENLDLLGKKLIAIFLNKLSKTLGGKKKLTSKNYLTSVIEKNNKILDSLNRIFSKELTAHIHFKIGNEECLLHNAISQLIKNIKDCITAA